MIVIAFWALFVLAVAKADRATADLVWVLLWLAIAVPVSIRILINFARRVFDPEKHGPDCVYRGAWPRWLTRFIHDEEK